MSSDRCCPYRRVPASCPAFLPVHACIYLFSLANTAAAHRPNLDRSVVLDIDMSAAPPTASGVDAAKEAWLPARVGSIGWEPNAAGKPGPRMSDLSSVLDPSRLAENSVRLNIKLMRWRALPELDVDLLEQTKCLLLGAGEERRGGALGAGVRVYSCFRMV